MFHLPLPRKKKVKSKKDKNKSQNNKKLNFKVTGFRCEGVVILMINKQQAMPF